MRRVTAASTAALILAGAIMPGVAYAAGPPVASPDTITTLVNTPAFGNVLANDTTSSGTLTVTGFTAVAPAFGSLSIASDGTYTFTPATDWTGTTSSSYTVTNGSKTRTAAITINVNPSNSAPTASNDTLSLVEDAAPNVTASILANDTDPDNDTLTVTAVTNVTGGSAGLAAGVVTFTLTANLCGAGAAGFDYTVSDGNGHTASAHATIDVTCVNDAPTALPDSASGTEDTDVTIDAAALAANDTDVDSPTLTVTAVGNATNGSVSLTAGVVTFVPAADVCGTAISGFGYTVDDGSGGTATGTVSVDLTCVNDGPTAVPDTVNGSEDTDLVLASSDLTGNDGDVDGDTLTITGVSNATGGTAVLDGNQVTFSPAADQCAPGLGGFDYAISDGNGGTSSASVTVNVSCVNDSPVPGADTLTGSEDQPVVVNAADLAANDTDADNDPISVTGVSGTSGGTIALNAGVITFTPPANACGTGIGGFHYTASDGKGGTATGSVTVNVGCVNDAPVATPDVATVANNSGPADHDVIGNDTDAENDTLSLVGASVDAAQGTVARNGNLVTFTPAAGFSGQAVITYTVTDGTDSTQGTLTVTVGEDVTAPITSAATVSFGKGRVNETVPLRIAWSAVDASSGVLYYDVQVSVAGSAFKSVYTGASTAVTKLYPLNKSLVFRVRATDKKGNTSDWVTSAARKAIAYQDGSSKLTKKGTWTTVASTGSSGTGYAKTTGKDKRLGLSFTGSAVLYVAPRISTAGSVKVYVDGVLLGRYSLQRSTTALGMIIASRTWASSGAHSIRVVSDTAKAATMDAFIVLK